MIQEIRDRSLDPAIVADIVLHAILQNELYIMSHPDFRDVVVKRTEARTDSIDRWANWRAEHGY